MFFQLNLMYFKFFYSEVFMFFSGQRMDILDDMFGEVVYLEIIEVFDFLGDRFEVFGCNINDMQVKILL